MDPEAPYIPNTASLAGTLWTGREHDACGTGFIARRDGVHTREVVDLALTAVERLMHRGAVGADDGDGEPTGDGAGVLTAIPWGLLTRELSQLEGRDTAELGLVTLFAPLPGSGQPGAGIDVQDLFETAASAIGIELVAWREVPVDADSCGAIARATRPLVLQAVLGAPAAAAGQPAAFGRLLLRLRRTAERAAADAQCPLHIPSCSARTTVYKGLLTALQLRRFYPDLDDPDYTSHLALFHQRYSTNTFPTWDRAQPCRVLAHNGEINTIEGNVRWIRARALRVITTVGQSDAFLHDDDGSWLSPIVEESGSDSMMLDDVAELLVHGGRDIGHALTMLVPPAWESTPDLPQDVRDLLRFHDAVVEPWDGPAALAFADGRFAGTRLDRNGLRPARWLETHDGLVGCSSEAGSIDIDPVRIRRTGMLGPGQSIVVDTQTGEFLEGDEPLAELAARAPYGAWADAAQLPVDGRADPQRTLLTNPAVHVGDEAERPPTPEETRTAFQAAFGYTREELTAIIRPMVTSGADPVGSMGDDTPLASLSDLHRSLFDCFTQRFAEVTNPAIDPIRERFVMSMGVLLGPQPDLLVDGPSLRSGPMLRLAGPLLSDGGLTAVLGAAAGAGLEPLVLNARAPRNRLGQVHIAEALRTLCDGAAIAVAHRGTRLLVLSDRGVDPQHAPIPSLLAVSAVHHHLVELGLRADTGIVMDSGEARETHHVAALIGYGADAVCPWLAAETAAAIGAELRQPLDASVAVKSYLDALEYGVRKVMAKMGISAVHSYCGAQIFDALGLSRDFTDRWFPGTVSQLGGIGMLEIDVTVSAWHAHARDWWAVMGELAPAPAPLPSPGMYKPKRAGERHAFDMELVRALHQAVIAPDAHASGFSDGYAKYREYLRLVSEQGPIDPRDMLEPRLDVPGAAIPIDDVEPARAILRRVSTGAISFGAISQESHEDLATALFRLGGRSNSGEGGEDPARFGTERGSAIKQVASGRFGVTPAYLQSARELQIKMAQGSKPGEGGQLPGHKVTQQIAAVRHTIPGVGLISPPPHHDIYSIEDLAQLVHDLSSANPAADISVKLVSQAGVGTVAVGVAKSRADVILISGASGGTGASPLGSIKHAGSPWELGLAETHQVLIANGLRGRVRLRADGGMRTGRDLLIAILLGAEEFSFGTAALVAQGCLMARTCHTDTCPVGIATQRPELRAKYVGSPERVMAFLLYAAQELRELMAALGARTVDELVGRTDLLRVRDGDTRGLDLSRLLAVPDVPERVPRQYAGRRNAVPDLDTNLDARVAKGAQPLLDAIDAGATGAALPPIMQRFPIATTDRTVGARLGGLLARRPGAVALADGQADLHFRGSAGQSFGAFSSRGMRLTLCGEANDYVGKGLAGAELVLAPDPESAMAADTPAHQIAGNACLYGATAGTLLAAGRAGGRFAVRNSGADAVVEGIGDHGCEYMTGGTVVVIGPVGRNFGAGMSGGAAYIWDPDGVLASKVNLGLVDITAPTTEEFGLVRSLVEHHATLTGSVHAQHVLDHWDVTVTQLRAVLPTWTPAAPAETPVAPPTDALAP